jgi:Domain of Unknown Function (DUF928)
MFKLPNFAFFLTALAMLLTTSESVLAQVRFKPPSTKPPIVTQSGGSRGECVTKTQRELQFVEALVPKGNFGLTTAANPTLMVYVPKSTAKSLKVELRSQDKKQILLRQNLSVPTSASIVPIYLGGANAPELQVGQNYYWRVILECPSGDNDFGANSIAQGWIQRIQPDTKLQDAISKAAPQTLPSIYAEAGIWFDALMSLDALRQQKPNDRLVTANWRSLLRSGQVHDAIIAISTMK